jgi:hypothetical protein
MIARWGTSASKYLPSVAQKQPVPSHPVQSPNVYGPGPRLAHHALRRRSVASETVQRGALSPGLHRAKSSPTPAETIYRHWHAAYGTTPSHRWIMVEASRRQAHRHPKGSHKPARSPRTARIRRFISGTVARRAARLPDDDWPHLVTAQLGDIQATLGLCMLAVDPYRAASTSATYSMPMSGQCVADVFRESALPGSMRP